MQRADPDPLQPPETLPAPSFASCRRRLVAAEQGCGWLSECDDAGRFLAVSREIVQALAGLLRRLAGDSTVLEVCAGSGELAGHLAACGARLRATDADPPGDTGVLRLPAAAALRRFQPSVVLAAFVPADARVEEAILGCPAVEHYVTLNARIGGVFGSAALGAAAGWQAARLPDIERWMLTRHDVWLGQESGRDDLLRHGEAWHFARSP